MADLGAAHLSVDVEAQLKSDLMRQERAHDFEALPVPVHVDADALTNSDGATVQYSR